MNENNENVQKILGSVTLWYDSKLLETAEQQLGEHRILSPSQHEDVKKILSANNLNAMYPKSSIGFDSFRNAADFDDGLRQLIMDEQDERGGHDQQGEFTPLLRPNQGIVVRLTGGENACEVELGEGYIFDEIVDAVVVPTNMDLLCMYPKASAHMNSILPPTYFAERMKYAGSLKTGDVIRIRTEGAIKAASIFHVIIDESDGLEQLCTVYSQIFAMTTQLKLASLALMPIIIGGKVHDSAQEAAQAVMYAISMGLIGTLGKIKIIGTNRLISQRFGMKFSSVCESVKKKPYERPAPNDEEDKMSVAMALEPKSAAIKEADKAAVQWLVDSIEVPDQKRRETGRPLQYAKRSVEEKQKKKKPTSDDMYAMDLQRCGEFITFLNEEFPPQEVCGMCDKDLGESELGTEICLRCYKTYHIDCLDSSAFGVCPVCIRDIKEGDQLEGGTVTVRVVEDAGPVEGYPDMRGRIEITYFIPCGLQGINHPEPGEFCFGIHRVAYLPNTKRGQKVAMYLKSAFELGLTFCIGRSLDFSGAYSVKWNCIPHKTSLNGGREDGGYPDGTYLDRVEKVLDHLLHEKEEKSDGELL